MKSLCLDATLRHSRQDIRERNSYSAPPNELFLQFGGNQARSGARTEFENLERSLKGGGEAGRAHDCTLRKFRHDPATNA